MATTTTERIGRFRWVICALRFFATTIDYVGRHVPGIRARLEPVRLRDGA